MLPDIGTREKCEVAVGQLESGNLPSNPSESLTPYNPKASECVIDPAAVAAIIPSDKGDEVREELSSGCDYATSADTSGAGQNNCGEKSDADFNIPRTSGNSPKRIPPVKSTVGIGGLKTTVNTPEALAEEQKQYAMFGAYGAGPDQQCCCPACQQQAQMMMLAALAQQQGISLEQLLQQIQLEQRQDITANRPLMVTPYRHDWLISGRHVKSDDEVTPSNELGIEQWVGEVVESMASCAAPGKSRICLQNEELAGRNCVLM